MSDWSRVIKRLRQDRELILLRSEQVRHALQTLNTSCDNLFQSLWINHTLALALNRVMSHRLPCALWVSALDQVESIKFIDAALSLTGEEIRAYSTFISNLVDSPLVVSELLHQADAEGLDTHRLASDLLAVVYSHCLFDRDHAQFMDVLDQLMSSHIDQCVTATELFGGVEPVFSRVLLEYCAQLHDLKVFLTHVFQDAIMRVLQYDSGYLEFDISKAGTRVMDGDSSEIDDLVSVGNNITSSCQQLADFCTLFLSQLKQHLELFPPTLRWLLCSLKRQIHKKWPKVTPFEVRRPLSYVLFGFILSSAFINPDVLGLLDRRLVLTNVGRYNLNQVGAVLQGCAWIIGRPDSASSYYSMQKVVKLVDMSLFISVVDSIDCSEGACPPLVSSVLPGLNRCFSLTSKKQLDELVAFTNSILSSHNDFGQLHLEVNRIMSAIPQSMHEQLHCFPYSFREPLRKASSQPLLDVETKTPATTPQSPVTKSPLRPKKKLRSSTVMTPKEKSKEAIAMKDKSQSLGRVKKSPSSLSSGDIETVLSAVSPLQESFYLPEEVLILPVVARGSSVAGSMSSNTNTLLSWELELMTEEEFIHHSESRVTSLSPLHTMSTSSSPSHSKKANSASDMDSPQRPPNLMLNSHPPSVTPPAVTPLSVTSSSVKPLPSSPLTGTDECLHSFSSSSYSPVTYDGSISTNDGEFSPLATTSADSQTKEKKGVSHFVFPSDDDSLERSDKSTSRRRVQLSSASCELLRGDKVATATTSRGTGTLPSSLPMTPSKKKKGFASRIKEKIHFRKKSRSTDNSAPTSPKSSADKYLEKNRRKPRSTSDVTDSLPFSPLTDMSRPRSYTKLTGHITEKYRVLSSQQKTSTHQLSAASRHSMKQDVRSGTSSDHTPEHVADLVSNVEVFRQCLMYRQLKYKLATALQNIHMPVPELREGQSCKDQLVGILTSALQQSIWLRQSSESSLLSEIVKILEPLSEDHVIAVLVGVRDDHRTREEYLSYLVNLKQLCHDTTLQVSAIQHTVDRTREVAKETFVHFVVQLFLESKEALLQQLARDLKHCAAADVECAMVDYLNTFKTMLEKDPCWLVWPSEDLALVYQCLEDHLFSHVYSSVFHPNGDSDKQRDQLFSDLLTGLSPQVTPQHQELKILPVYHTSCPWPEAQKKLLTMDLFKSPDAKLSCVVECCRLLIRLLQLAKCGDPPGADDTFPALIYIVIKSNPPSLLSTLQYIQTYCDRTISGEEAYWWTQFMIAVECTKTPGFTQ